VAHVEQGSLALEGFAVGVLWVAKGQPPAPYTSSNSPRPPPTSKDGTPASDAPPLRCQGQALPPPHTAVAVDVVAKMVHPPSKVAVEFTQRYNHLHAAHRAFMLRPEREHAD
jgi:hypothetical protein